MPRRCPLAPLVDRTRTPLGPYWTRARDMSNAQPAERRKCVSPAFVFRAPCVSPWSSRPTARVPLPRLIAHFTSPVKRRSLFRAKAPPQAPLEPVNVNYRAQVRKRAVSCPLVTPTRNPTRGPSSRHDTQMFLNSPDAFVFPPFANAGHRPDPPPPGTRRPHRRTGKWWWRTVSSTSDGKARKRVVRTATGFLAAPSSSRMARAKSNVLLNSAYRNPSPPITPVSRFTNKSPMTCPKRSACRC